MILFDMLDRMASGFMPAAFGLNYTRGGPGGVAPFSYPN